jgi:hypothetical protein
VSSKLQDACHAAWQHNFTALAEEDFVAMHDFKAG